MTLHTDARGLPLPGANAAAAAAYDDAVEAMSVFLGDPVGALNTALAEAPDFAGATLFKAWLYALSTEPRACAKARKLIDPLFDRPLPDREAAHLAALDLTLKGEWTAAGQVLTRLNMDWPHDLAGLQVAHQSDFFRASARDLRDRIARALPAWSADMPGQSTVIGMYAFGLEEMGDYAAAEAAGIEATSRDARDSWAHHAVAHVYDMQGRSEDGLAWMTARAPHWANDDSFFQVHNWWHKALYHLEVCDTDAALAVYDSAIVQGPEAMATNLIDASALLWRLDLAGVDTGDRWDTVADTWAVHADGQQYPFNDWHAAMAYLGAGRMAEVGALLARMTDPDRPGETALWARTTGADLIAGFTAFHAGNHAEAATRLLRTRAIVGQFGGSHAQRDIIDLTLTEAALRGNLTGVGRAMASERLALKPHSPLNAGFARRAEALAPA